MTLFPCNECAKAIIQAGIKKVVYDCDKYADTASVIASKTDDGSGWRGVLPLQADRTEASDRGMKIQSGDEKE